MLVEGEDLCCFQQLAYNNLDHYMGSGAGRMSYVNLPTVASTHLTQPMNRDLTHYLRNYDCSCMSCGEGLIDVRGASCSRAINFFDYG
jgi:hypothetical protein